MRRGQGAPALRLLVLTALLVTPTREFAPPPLQPALRRAPRRGLRMSAGATTIDTSSVAVVSHASPPQGVSPAAAPNNKYLRKLWALQRSLFIWKKVSGQAWRVFILRRRQLRGAERVEANRKFAAGLRDTLILLGPTFIKIGQLLSTRVDVLPPEVIKELSRLQNEVPSFPTERALAVIRAELGKDADELFDNFQPTPLAAASLAQVHRATLKGTGEEVVVKVQRENLLDLFRVDLANIQIVAKLADRFDPQTESASANWADIAATSGKVLYREVDFNNERAAAQTFGENFKAFDNVKIPGVHAELSSSKVLTLEYVPGIKISDTEKLDEAGFNQEQISDLLTTSYLEQVCRHGFFHCDPHPGNLAVDGGYPGGRLIYYDFGMMETMEPDIKKGFVDLIFAIYENLPLEACDALEAMGVLRRGIDRQSIEKIARNMLNTFQSTLTSADNKWENQMSEAEKKASRRQRRAQLGQDLFATQAERPFNFPPKWTFVFRAFSTIDGIGKGLNPGLYDLSRISQPYLRELANLRDGSTTTTAIREVGRRLGLRPEDIAQAVTQPRKVASVAESIRRIEEGEIKLRVRTLEVERTLERMELRQRFYGTGLGAAVAYMLSRSAVGILWQQIPFLALAAKCSFECWRAQAGLQKFEEQRKRFSNEGSDKYDSVDLTPGE